MKDKTVLKNMLNETIQPVKNWYKEWYDGFQY